MTTPRSQQRWTATMRSLNAVSLYVERGRADVRSWHLDAGAAWRAGAPHGAVRLRTFPARRRRGVFGYG